VLTSDFHNNNAPCLRLEQQRNPFCHKRCLASSEDLKTDGHASDPVRSKEQLAAFWGDTTLVALSQHMPCQDIRNMT
jgi:hypothetical protein